MRENTTEDKALLTIAVQKMRASLSDADRTKLDGIMEGVEDHKLGFFSGLSVKKFLHSIGILLGLEKSCDACGIEFGLQEFGWNTNDCLSCEPKNKREKRGVLDRWEASLFEFKRCPDCNVPKAGLAFAPGEPECRACESTANKRRTLEKWLAEPCGSFGKEKYCSCDVCQSVRDLPAAERNRRRKEAAKAKRDAKEAERAERERIRAEKNAARLAEKERRAAERRAEQEAKREAQLATLKANPEVYAALDHGKAYTYAKKGCRCQLCCQAMRESQRNRKPRNRRKREARNPEPSEVHRRRELKPCGTMAAYERGCRCELCRGAKREQATKERRANGAKAFKPAQH